MKPHSIVCLLTLIALLTGCRRHGPEIVAVDLPQISAKQKLTVSSRAISAGSAISRLYSSYGENAQPDIEWTAIRNAKSYAIIVEDPDAQGEKPFSHWVVWNIPIGSEATVTVQKDKPTGIAEGTNGLGTMGYFGPRPPIRDEPHYYHFEAFALDSKLGLAAGADRDALVAAMEGHVLASGELVATYQER